MVDDAKFFASNYISGILFTSLARDRCLQNKIGRFLSQTLLSTKLETLSDGVEITIGRRGGGKPNVGNLGFSGYRFAIELGRYIISKLLGMNEYSELIIIMYYNFAMT